MKLVITIISNNDVEKVLDALVLNGYFATKISTSGQFLVDGNTALLICCEDERVDRLYSLLKETVTKRKIKTQNVKSTLTGSLLNQAVDVEEYGAVAFMTDIERFEKF